MLTRKKIAETTDMVIDKVGAMADKAAEKIDGGVWLVAAAIVLAGLAIACGIMLAASAAAGR